MKRRTTRHTPGPLSRPFETDTLRAVMIPGANLVPPVVLARLKEHGDHTDDHNALLFGFLMAFALWDDPDLCWENEADPDAVFNMDGEQLHKLADDLFKELLKPSVFRLGVETQSILRLGLEAAAEWLPSTKATLDAQRAADTGEEGKEAALAGE